MNKPGTNENNESRFSLHASSVNINGKALVFLGHSTSGKSTIAEILSSEFPKISDDKVLLLKNGANWFLQNGDKYCERVFAGNPNLKKEGIFQILSFMRIYKSDKNEIKKIENPLLCRYLTDAVFEVDQQRRVMDIKLRKEWFSAIADISRKFEGRHFFFKKELNVISILKKEFEY